MLASPRDGSAVWEVSRIAHGKNFSRTTKGLPGPLSDPGSPSHVGSALLADRESDRAVAVNFCVEDLVGQCERRVGLEVHPGP